MHFGLSSKRWFWVVPGALVSLVAYFQARGVSSLLGATLISRSGGGGARFRAARPAASGSARSGDPVLERNAFDSATGPLTGDALEAVLPPPPAPDPLEVPRCGDVRVVATAESEDPLESQAVLQVEGDDRGVVRRVGDPIGDRQVAFIGHNPLEMSPGVWLLGETGLCQSLVFDQPSLEPRRASNAKHESKPKKGEHKSPKGRAKTPKLPSSIRKKIAEIGPGRYRVERSALEAIIEKATVYMKSVRIRPQKEGDKVVGVQLSRVQKGTLLDVLGLKNGDRIQSINGFELAGPAQALQAYARLRLADNIRVQAVRGGRPLELEYRIQ